ncbi:hypothetical protein JCM11641_002257 [Rhodosporidiobolus odoratus]
MENSPHHVLSTHPLNSEPPLSSVLHHFLTPISSLYNRNHGEPVKCSSAEYSLSVSSDVDDIELSKSSFSLEDVKQIERREVVAVLSCAGNRRQEMDSEKGVEGLQWGGSAVANCSFAGSLLREVLSRAGLELGKLEQHGLADKLHLHFETSQECQDDNYFASSLPVKLALDQSRPVLLAYEQNAAPLSEAHGAPLRLVVPGIIGARSVKWIQRIILRDHESDNFYQQCDYKVLPPEASPETKEQFMKHTPPMMEYPLNSEICEPSEGTVVQLAEAEPRIEVKGYAIGAHGIPISSVHVTLIPLPVSSAPASPSLSPDITSSELYHIRYAASVLPKDSWTAARLVSTPEGGDKKWQEGEKNYGWTLWSARVEVSNMIKKIVETSAGGGEGVEVALVAHAEDLEGKRQELQTEWNLRGVAEASWSVAKVKLRKTITA